MRREREREDRSKKRENIAGLQDMVALEIVNISLCSFKGTMAQSVKFV